MVSIEAVAVSFSAGYSYGIGGSRPTKKKDMCQGHAFLYPFKRNRGLALYTRYSIVHDECKVIQFYVLYSMCQMQL